MQRRGDVQNPLRVCSLGDEMRERRISLKHSRIQETEIARERGGKNPLFILFFFFFFLVQHVNKADSIFNSCAFILCMGDLLKLLNPALVFLI